MFKLLHAGFDKLDVAFCGALPSDAIEKLREARDLAAKQQDDELVTIGPGSVEMHISPSGMRGGYAFVGDTGPLGAKWFFKDNTNPSEWNIFAVPRASALAANGYHGTRDNLFQQLKAMGCEVRDHSVNRADFAMDFLTSEFELHLLQFVTHARCKIKPWWGERPLPKDRDQPTAVINGRRLESVTIGKMPGRQIIVYDKRRAAIQQSTPYWFKVWGIAADEPAEVWRVEIRAGKNELKEKYRLRTFPDLEIGIGDVFANAAEDVRYLAEQQTDSNVTRQELHPLWQAVQQALACSLTDYRSGLTAGQLLEIERELAKKQYLQLVLGNAAGLSVALGMDDDAIRTDLPRLIREQTTTAVQKSDGSFTRSVSRARKRLRFIEKRD